LRTSAKTRPSTARSYVERVNLAIDYVMTHLEHPLRLDDVSRAAMLSPFHFHRVFQVLVGATIADFVKRLRLEKALSMMAFSIRSRRPSLTTIALACGFSSSSDFSRCFKQRFGVAPSVFNMNAWRDAHASQLEEVVAAATEASGRGLHLDRLPAGHNPDGFKATVRDLPARTVAYIRVPNPYRGDGVSRAVRRLVLWAERHSLADGQWLGYQWENPEITALEDCQYCVAVEAERFTPVGEIGRFRFPPMAVAQVEIRGGIDLELRALQWLYGTWLPASGYVPDDYPGFEAWIGRPFAHGTKYFEIYAQLPVRRG
jgi:AraC family transcriptional regulator